jgi:predicted RND superfamily exporter protein
VTILRTLSFFPSYTALILRHRFIVIVLISLVTLFLVIGIKDLHVQVDPNADLPQDHPYVVASNDIERDFVGSNIVVIGIESLHGDIYNKQVMDVIKSVTRQITQLPGVVPNRIQSISASRIKDIAATSDGISVQQFLERNPTSEKEFQHLKERIYANPVYMDSLVSKDRRAAFIVVDFRLQEVGGYRNILKNVQSQLDSNGSKDVRFYLGGHAVSLAWLEIYSERMQQWFLIVLTVVMVVSYLTFGTLQATFIPILTGLVSVLWTVGIMGWVSIPMDMYNVATPILIMTVGHGHSVQILKRYYEELPRSGNRNQAITRALIAVGPVMLTATGIATLSFLALVTFPLKTIQVFGAMAALGIAATLVLELTLIPALRSVIHSSPLRNRNFLFKHFNPFDRFITYAGREATRRHYYTVFIVASVVVFIALAGALLVHIDNSLKGNFAPQTEVRQDDEFLNSHSGGTNSLYILFEGTSNDTMKDPLILHGIEEIDARLHRAFPVVGKTQSMVDFLKKMNAAMHGDDPAFYRLPETQELAAQYMFLYSSSADAGDFDLYVDYGYRSALLWTFLRTDSTAYFERMIMSVKDWGKELLPDDVQVRFGGSVAEAFALNEVMVHGKVMNLTIIGTSVFFLASLALGSPLGGAYVLVPLVLTVLTNFGVMGWLGIRFDVATAVISALAVGIGADYAIYLLARIREELESHPWDIAVKNAVQSAGHAIVSVALAVGSGYSVLLFSGFRAHMRLGGLVALAMTVSCASAILILPALLGMTKPAFLNRPPSKKSKVPESPNIVEAGPII